MAENSQNQQVSLDVLSEALRGPRLSESVKYNKFLQSARYFNKKIEPIRPDMAPDYYVHMSSLEQEDHEVEIEFFNAANFKKIPPAGMSFNLDTLSKNPGFAELSVGETERLFQIPGVKKAVEIFVEVFDNDRTLAQREKINDDGKITIEDYSLRTAKNHKEVDICRKVITEEIKTEVLNGHMSRGKDLIGVDNSSELDLKCREAEQAAFALAYVSGIFDSLDSVWTDEGRDRALKCFNDCVNIPMKLAMNPMDWILVTFNKNEDDVMPYKGKLGLWGFEQATKSANGIKLKIKNVLFIADEDDPRSRDNYWKVSDNGETVIVPECCPRKLTRSVLEETTVGPDDNKIPLIEFIRNRQPIPWDDVQDNMWSDFGTKISKATVISDHLQGKVPVQWGDTTKYEGWAREIEDALAKFGLRKNEKLKRWILYAALGIKVSKRYPVINSRTDRLASPAAFGENGANFLPKNKMFFPWDN